MRKNLVNKVSTKNIVSTKNTVSSKNALFKTSLFKTSLFKIPALLYLKNNLGLTIYIANPV